MRTSSSYRWKFFLWSMAAIAAAGAPACVEFNTECSPPIDAPDEVVTHLAEPVQVSRAVVRTQESALGNAITDAYVAAFERGWTGAKPIAALENAGGIRDLGLCITRTQLSKGPVTRRVLRDTLPFANELVVVELTALELFDVLEHGVATLARPGVTPSGQFLHVSGLSYEVDCSMRPEEIDGDGARRRGERVLSYTIAGATITRADAVGDTRRFPVAISDFLAEGGDNFLDLGARAKILREAGREPYRSSERYAYNVVEEYLGRIGTSDSPARLAVDPEKPRIRLTNCD